MKRKSEKFSWWVLMVLVCTLAMGGLVYTTGEAAAASVPDIKIGVAFPLSGAASHNGTHEVQSIKAAIGWVNDNGGIKSLGGAKLTAVVADTGSSVEGAASTMARVCKDPDIFMTMGCYLSSMTLAATEVTERLGIPHFSCSWQDPLHQRGFKWGFYLEPPASRIGGLGGANLLKILKEVGMEPKTVFALSETNPGAMMTNKACVKYFVDHGVKLVGEERFTGGTLSDATPIVLKIKNSNPDLVVFDIGARNEIQVFLMKCKEMGIKSVLASAGAEIMESTLRPMSDLLDGVLGTGPIFYNKLMPQEWIKRTLDQVRKEYQEEAWMGQNLARGWQSIPVVAELLERTGSRDRNVFREAARKLDIHDVPATRGFSGQGIAFDENNRIAEKYQNFLIMQWQKGTVYPVSPANLAYAKPILVKK